MPLQGFNDSLSIFLPKGDHEGDASEISRNPGDTRPLFLKNTDNKTLCSIYNNMCRKMLSAGNTELQRGFVPGRQFLGNVVELDSMSRIYGMRNYNSELHSPSCSQVSSCCFWDFAAAFPSVAPQWVFAVSRAIGAPLGIYIYIYIYITLSVLCKAITIHTPRRTGDCSSSLKCAMVCCKGAHCQTRWGGYLEGIVYFVLPVFGILGRKRGRGCTGAALN